MSQITINGLLKLAPGNQTLADARVEIWDDAGNYGWLASATSNKKGEFSIIIDEPHSSLITATTITVAYRVFRNGESINIDSVATVGDFEEITIRERDYDGPTRDRDKSVIVTYIDISGKIVTSKGIAATDVKVNVYQGGFRDKTILTATTVDMHGQYKAKVAVKNLSNYELPNDKCIHIEVLDDSDGLLVRSKDYFKLTDELVVDLIIQDEEYAPITEYEALLEAVTGIIDSADIVSITRNEATNIDEFAFIAKSIGKEVRDIENLVNAYVFSNEIDPTVMGNYIYADFFYAINKLSSGNSNPSKFYNNEKLELAIETAIEDHVIPEHTEMEINTFISKAKAFHIAQMRTEPILLESFTVNEVLMAIFDDTDDVKNLLALYNSKEYTEVSDFWDLYKITYATPKYVLAQKGLKLISLTGIQPEMITFLLDETTASDNLSDLATWDSEDWYEAVDDICVANTRLCVPASIRGAETDPGNTEVKEAYADFLKIHFQEYYPLTTIKGVLAGATGSGLIADSGVRAKVIAFIEDNPEFDLRMSTIHEINDEDYEIDEADVDVVKGELEPFQRLLRVTQGKPEAVIQMKLDNIDSATAIMDIDEDEFISTYSAKLGGAPFAKSALNNASTMFSAAQNLTTGFQTNMGFGSSGPGAGGPGGSGGPNGPYSFSNTPYGPISVPTGPVVSGPGVPPPSSSGGSSSWPTYTPIADPSEDPTWTNMFGSLDYCCCDHCMSLYSPAAYFTDILNFLKTNNTAAYTELTRRRKDLIYIDLTCKNTNTPVPYVDLVNELLEGIIVGPTNSPESYQTNGTAKELAAHPEHFYKDGSGDYVDIANNGTYYPAYQTIYNTTLADATYPTFNFNYALEEVRTYLKHLGISRHDAMKLFEYYNADGIVDEATVPAAEVSDYWIGMESLNLTPTDAELICGTHGHTDLGDRYRLYGFPAVLMNIGTNLLDPADPSSILTGWYYDILKSRIDLLLYFSKISYMELLKFLSTDFINPIDTGTSQLMFGIEAVTGASPDTCDLKLLELKMDSSSMIQNWFTDRLHRFLRLYRRNTLSIYEWDTLFRQLSIGMDQGNPGVNLNNSAVLLLSEVLQLSKKLDIDPLVLVGWTSQIDTKHYIAHDCAGITEHPSVYDKIFRNKATQNPPSPLFGEDATFPTTDFISNAAEIASVCGVSEDDMLLLLDFVTDGTDPLSTAAMQIELTGLSRLHTLCEISKALKMSVKEMLTVFKFNLVTEIDTPTWDDLNNLISTVELLRKSPFTINEIDYLVCNEDERGISAPDDLTIQLFYQDLRSELRKLRPYSNPSTTLVDEMLDDAQALINIVFQHFSKQFNISSVWVEKILEAEIELPDPPSGILGDLIENSFVVQTDDLDPILQLTDSNLYDRYRLFHKVAMIGNALKLRNNEFIKFYDATSPIDFDYSGLPIGVPNPLVPLSADEFDGLARLLKWIEVRDRLALIEPDFTFLIDMANGSTEPHKDIWRAILKANTTWDTWLDELVGTGIVAGVLTTEGGKLDTLFPADFNPGNIAAPSLILNVIDIVDLCKRVGLNPITLQKVLMPDLTISDSNKVRFAAKGKHDENAWLKIAKPLQDNIRERQRCALVNYVLCFKQDPVNYRIWKTESDLYAYLLIDVEMTPCMLTSRIKQGISSVQLFVDRILLSQEYTAAVSPVNIALQPQYIKQWREWRKWYRVWEANRKVFLYPENWIEPELRDDKTVFFEELETKLAQGDITDSLVQEAMRDYLFKLSDVANLEPVGFAESFNDELQKGIIHAFARTYEQPNQYYYRRLMDDEWTGWERVSIDITSRHVVPLVKNNRLFLFWITFTEKKIAMSQSEAQFASTGSNGIFYNDQNSYNEEVNNGNATRQNCLEISLNWSEYKDGEFEKQKVSHSKLTLKLNPFIELYLKGKHDHLDPSSGYYNTLSENRNIGAIELIKSRLCFYPYTDGDLRFMMMFPFEELVDGIATNDPMDQYDRLHYLAGFMFKDINGQPEINTNWELWNFPTIENTYFNDMRFNEFPLGGDKKLKVEDSMSLVQGSNYRYNFNVISPNSDIIKPASYSVILNSTADNGIFKVVSRNDHGPSGMERNFFFYDDKHTFFARKVKSNKAFGSVLVNPGPYPLNLNNQLPNVMYPPVWNLSQKFFFQTFYHPHINEFLLAFANSGVHGFLNIDMQAFSDQMDFVAKYQPTSLVLANSYPTDKVELDFWGAYAVYNWELFFHIPMLLAQRLGDNQRFDEAQKWFHYVFDPTSNTGLGGTSNTTKQRFWKFKLFYDQAGMNVQSLNDLLILIAWNDANTVAQVEKWKNNPFKPHMIARTRILAYMKNVVMKYLDNIIAWADQLFSRDTIESINEATNLYILAANILGPRPTEVPKRAYVSPKAFNEIASTLDAFSNATVTIESYISPNVGPLSVPTPGGVGKPPKMFYFCLSPNDKLLKYWDTIADRLYKIRNCRNISGQIRQLPLFEPPIDPAMLVRAAAAGVDINSILDDVSNANLPAYRFTYMLQKANEICSDLKGLGGSLLSALEKKDAEELALIRSTQEANLLDNIKLMKMTQLNEARANLTALTKSREITEVKRDYYSSREFYNSYENEYFASLKKATRFQKTQANLQALASAVSIIPQFHAQVISAVGAQFGGQQIAAILNGVAQKLGANIAKANFEATVANTKGGYQRRWEDWDFQKRSSLKEIEQINLQIAAAEIRVAIAERDIENQELQIENNRETDAYMRSKYTNKQLYNWMITQISATYFQAYRLAYEIARKAGKCYDYELPLAQIESNKIIQFGYWDSLRKGLLVGEDLQNDLRKLEQAYIRENKRTLELTKHVSLATLDADKLRILKTTGTCEIAIPELLYDMDYPGHFNRRIKSVSITIPCVAGPYTTVPCTLSLMESHVRIEPVSAALLDQLAPPSASVIATSSAQNDNGMFEFNFRDERYLPFEGAGAISKWNLKLGGVSGITSTYRPFDFDTIGDVILHVKYTAHDGSDSVDGGPTFGANRIEAVVDAIGAGEIGDITTIPLPLMVSLKHEFSSEWFAAFNHLVNTDDREFSIPINIDMFPHIHKVKGVEITKVHFIAVPKVPGDNYEIEMAGSDPLVGVVLTEMGQYYSEDIFDPLVPNPQVTSLAGYNLEFTMSAGGTPNEADFDNFYIVLDYKTLP